MEWNSFEASLDLRLLILTSYLLKQWNGTVWSRLGSLTFEFPVSIYDGTVEQNSCQAAWVLCLIHSASFLIEQYTEQWNRTVLRHLLSFQAGWVPWLLNLVSYFWWNSWTEHIMMLTRITDFWNQLTISDGTVERKSFEAALELWPPNSASFLIYNWNRTVEQERFVADLVLWHLFLV